MMIGILIPLMLLIPTPAKACSPPLDGSEFTCPPWDTEILEKPKGITDQTFEDNLDPDVFDQNQYEVTIFDTRDNIAHMGHSFPTGEWIEKLRNWESRRKRTPIEDMLNNTLAEYENGSDETAKQEELLQLPSDGD